MPTRGFQTQGASLKFLGGGFKIDGKLALYTKNTINRVISFPQEQVLE